MDSFKNSNMQREQINSNLIQHKLWNPVPRKLPRTDESQTNLMNNILCNLIQEGSNVKPFEEIKSSQGNIFQSFARALFQNPELVIGLPQQVPSPSNNSDLYNSLTPISKTEVSSGSQAYQNDIRFDLFKSSNIFFKKINSAPVISESFSNSQKIFLDSVLAQNSVERHCSGESVSKLNGSNQVKESLHPKKKSQQKKKCKKCNCKNSKCLKLYCECLATGEYCGPDCGCQNCHNNPDCELDRSQAISLIIEKNPYAFHATESTPTPRQKPTETAVSKPGRHKGCTCKRSGCNKKYCECFSYGISCGEHCRCENCKNCDETKKHGRGDFEEGYGSRIEIESNAQSMEDEESSSVAVKIDSTKGTPISKADSIGFDILGLKRENLQSLALFRSLTDKAGASVSFKPRVLQRNPTENNQSLDTSSVLASCGGISAFDKENLLKN